MNGRRFGMSMVAAVAAAAIAALDIPAPPPREPPPPPLPPIDDRFDWPFRRALRDLSARRPTFGGVIRYEEPRPISGAELRAEEKRERKRKRRLADAAKRGGR